MCLSEATGKKKKKKKKKHTADFWLRLMWCFVCDYVLPGKCPPLVPVWGQSLAFRWINTPVFSDKSRASESSQHPITSARTRFNELHKPTVVSSFLFFCYHSNVEFSWIFQTVKLLHYDTICFCLGRSYWLDEAYKKQGPCHSSLQNSRRRHGNPPKNCSNRLFPTHIIKHAITIQGFFRYLNILTRDEMYYLNIRQNKILKALGCVAKDVFLLILPGNY